MLYVYKQKSTLHVYIKYRVKKMITNKSKNNNNQTKMYGGMNYLYESWNVRENGNKKVQFHSNNNNK